MSKHTSEPWFYHRQGFSTVYIEARIGGGMLQEIAACGPCQDGTEQQDENASRIVACVNACAGLPTEQLESSPPGGILNGVAGLIAQRSELLAALEIIAASEEFHGDSFVCDFGALQWVARAAIAKAKGGAA